MKVLKPNTRLHWLPLWLGLYAGILIFSLTAALTNPSDPNFQLFTILTNAIKLLGIASVLIFALIYLRQDQLLLLALLFTLVADIFLTQHNYAFGLAVFACAQFAHLCRLTRSRRLPLIYIGLTAIYLLICIFCRLPLVLFSAPPYAFFLLTNLVLAWVRSGTTTGPSNSFLANYSLGLGFTFFLLCDACVALSYFSEIALLPVFIKPITDIASWIFYYPSQILISSAKLSTDTNL